MIKFRFLSLLALFCLAGVPVTQAQKVVPGSTAAPVAKMDSAYILEQIQALPQQDQDEILKEGPYAENYCHENQVFSNFYDCECVGNRMIEERFKKGPEETFSSIILDADLGSCVSDALVAGYSYQRCVDSMKYAERTTQETETICQCSARSMATRFKAQPIADMRYISSLYDSIMDDCR